MTEEEAKTKWCPMARFSHASYGAGDSFVEVATTHNEGARCIASGCMMWRHIYDGLNYSESSDGMRIYNQRQRHGYCGLGGNYD